MTLSDNSVLLSQNAAIERRGACEALVLQPFEKGPRSNASLHQAKMHAMVYRDDASSLHKALADFKDELWSEKTAKNLWYFSLLEGKPRTFELLSKLSQEKSFRFLLSDELDAMPEALQLWALDIPFVRNMWLSTTKPLSPSWGYTHINGLRVLQYDDSVKELQETLNAKSNAFHARMGLFIDDFAMQTLMRKGSFLHTIAYYKEPTKKHLRVAATGVSPVYDLVRMELHWPGITSAVSVLTGLGLSSSECESRIRKMISNKSTPAEQHALPVDFSMD